MQNIRSELYMLASGLFNFPDTTREGAMFGLAQGLRRLQTPPSPWSQTLEALAQDLAREYSRRILNAEYCRLFIHAQPTVPAQPYGSYWLEHGAFAQQGSAWEVEELMAHHELGVTEESGLAPDHIAAELEFMSYLAQDQRTLESQRWLLERHLTRWSPLFTQAVRAARPLERFRLAADLVDKLVSWDTAYLQRLAAVRTRGLRTRGYL